jgi:hypothetical protein
MTLGEEIDELYKLRTARIDLQCAVDAMHEREKEMREQIMNALDANGMAKGSGHLATGSIKISREPVAIMWEEIHQYIRDENRFDLVQKRLSVPAWRGLLDAGILVPGTEVVQVRDLSLTKATRG